MTHSEYSSLKSIDIQRRLEGIPEPTLFEFESKGYIAYRNDGIVFITDAGRRFIRAYENGMTGVKTDDDLKHRLLRLLMGKGESDFYSEVVNAWGKVYPLDDPDFIAFCDIMDELRSRNG